MRIGLVLLLAGLASPVFAETKAVEPFTAIPERGEVRFTPTAVEAELPERFRQKPHVFAAEAETVGTAGSVRSYDVRFPTPLPSGSRRNDIVTGRYFQPHGPGPHPGVVLLHPRHGGFALIHTVADLLARRGVATFAIELPYHGDRFDPKWPRRMVSTDANWTIEAVTQAVLDVRRAHTWLAARPEVNAKRVGITGVSLGGFVAATAAALEPNCDRLAVVLAGGDVTSLVWNHWDPQAKAFRRRWTSRGGTRESLERTIADIEPTTHAPRLKGRSVLMIAATDDEIVPRASTVALHDALDGKPELVWLDAGHLTAMFHVYREIDRVAEFLRGE